MAMKLPTLPTHDPMRVPAFMVGKSFLFALRILASPFGASPSPAMSGTTLERSRMRPLSSMMPGFSRPGAPKRTSFMDVFPLTLRLDDWVCGLDRDDHATPRADEQAKRIAPRESSSCIN